MTRKVKPLIQLEQLEPRILLSADGLLNAIVPDQDQDMSLDGMQDVIQYAELLETQEQVEEQVTSDTSNNDNCQPILTLLPDDNTNDESVDADLSVDNIGSAQIGDVLAVLSNDSCGDIESKVVTTDDGSMPIYINDADLSIEYATSIEIRGPPASGTIALSGMHLVDPTIDYFNVQVVYLDFDGANDVTYNGPLTIEGIDIPAFAAHSYLSGQEHAVIDQILEGLRQTFAGSGVVFTVEKPEPHTLYSTIYIGGDDSAFSEYGSFLGLAEQVDVGNKNFSDKAFVFSGRNLMGQSSADCASKCLVDIIAHEAGHLLGYAHDSCGPGEGVLFSVAEEDPLMPEEPQIPLSEFQVPGRLEATGTHFELEDSEYINITLDSSESVKLILESVPKMIVMHIEAAESAVSTEITLTGFPASTTYYKYEDDYHNGVSFITDDNGAYSYAQDLTEPHLIFIQPDASTRFLPTDTEIGTWDPVTRTYTLTTDVYETIQIDEDNLTLDGTGYTVTGTGSSNGVYIYGRTGVKIKNLNVQKFHTGIRLYYSDNCTLTGNSTNNNSWGIRIWRSDNNAIAGNTTIGHNGYDYGIALLASSNNTIAGNNTSHKRFGVHLRESSNNTLINNNTTNNHLGMYLTYSGRNNLIDNIVGENIKGIWLDYSNINIIRSNIVSGNATNGLYLHASRQNMLADNNITNNNTGISLTWYSGSNTVTHNNSSENVYGIYLYAVSINNEIYNNNFIDNTYQVYVYGSSGHIFNLDRPIGGNYWSDWTSPDNNGDGFVDSPYVFAGGQDNLPWVNQDGWLSENYFNQSSLNESLLSEKANLADVAASGDFESTLDFTSFEIITITTGPFAGKGFSKGQFETTLDGVSYKGSWQGVMFLKAEEKKIYLKGSVTGEILATVEGYITESIPESGIYDQYEATWKITCLGTTISSASIRLNGIVSYQSASEFHSVGVYILQTNLDVTLYGHYSGPLSTVLTHIRVAEEGNPYYGEGFSIISYVSGSGSGQGWTYDNLLSPTKVAMNGFFDSPLFGIANGVLDESELPRRLFFRVARIDLALPPAQDLKVRTWGPNRVSPGQTVNYIIEYRNDGLMSADQTEVRFEFPECIEYRSSSQNEIYDWEIHGVAWSMENIAAKSASYLYVTGYAPWGLSEGTPLRTYASIYPKILPSQIMSEENSSLFSITAENNQNVDYTDWRTNLTKGDILLVHYNGVQIIPGYWDHTGIYDGSGYVIEATDRHGGVKRHPIETWDFPAKTDVAIYRVTNATQEQIDAAVNFAEDQVDDSFSYRMLVNEKSSSYDNTNWYCSELVWAAYYNQGIDIEHNPAITAIAPQEIAYDNDVEFVWGHGEMEGGAYYPHSLPEWAKADDWVSESKGQILVARDPNIKYGPEGRVLPGQQLNYVVEYENEGEGIAFGVYFTDTLDEDLDDSTLEIGLVVSTIDGSVIAEPGIYNIGTRTITWFVGEVGPGEGGITEFSVNVRDDAKDGTEIINYATVYFPSVPEETRTNGIVSIVSLNQPPVAAAGGPYTVAEGGSVLLDASGTTDPDLPDDVLTYEWDFDGDGEYDDATGVHPTFSAALLDGPDSKTVGLKVADSYGEFNTSEAPIDVINVAPSLADAAFELEENSPNATIVGSVIGTDPGDDTLTYSIVGGNGATAFAIDANSGQITVADATQLDYETTPSFTVDVLVVDDDGAIDNATVTINLLNQASITGTVFVDVNGNGVYEANEPGIDGIIIELLHENGIQVLDAQNNPVTAVTSDGGFYLFEDLDPGTYLLREVQPTGVDDGVEILGSLGGTIPANDTMRLTLERIDATDYSFAELGQLVASGDTATIGFWQNKHGQALIRQGGTALADWLSNNFGNVFGDTFVGGDGNDVASFYRDQLFRQKSQKSAGPAKADAQFMAVALATYFTSSNLAGNVASAYGFNVTDTGIGTKLVNIGDNGTAFSVSNGTDLTIMQLLLATDNLTDQPDSLSGSARIYDLNGDGEIEEYEADLRTQANDVFSSINEQGDI